MFEALGSLVGIALVIGGIVFVIVKGASGSKRPPYGRPGAVMPPHHRGQFPPPGQQFPQQGPYPPQGQWQAGMPYPTQPGPQQHPSSPYPVQQGYSPQPGYPPAAPGTSPQP